MPVVKINAVATNTFFILFVCYRFYMGLFNFLFFFQLAVTFCFWMRIKAQSALARFLLTDAVNKHCVATTGCVFLLTRVVCDDNAPVIKISAAAMITFFIMLYFINCLSNCMA